MTRADGVEFSCDSCGCDLSNLVQIRCNECKEYDLCVPCFAKGSHSGTHKPWHDYMVIEQHAYPIFTDDWGADEEMLLIEGCEQYGIGSWQDIAEHIGGRTREEVADHYEHVYMESRTYPVPELDHHFDVDPIDFVNQRQARLEKFHADAQSAPILPKQTLASVPACHDIQGYMPGRLEFDVEAENDAEMSIKDMVFEPDDIGLDIDQKLAVLEIYNSRLIRRAERKRVILSHNLLAYRHLTAVDKRRSKDDKELANRLKAFVRLLPLHEYDEFLESMLAEQQYRQRISELQEYRQQGIHTIAEANKYEKEKQNRYNFQNRTSLPPPPPRQATMHLDRGNNSGIHGPTIKIRKFGSGSPLDISTAPDVDLLSPQERSLCMQLHMMPRAYLAVKETVFQALVQNGGTLKKKSLREVLNRMDENKVGRIYDFFQTQNWIS